MIKNIALQAINNSTKMSKQKKQEHHSGIEDVEQALTRTEQFVVDNQKTLSIIAVVILAVVAIVVGYNRFILAPKESEARSEMFMAEKFFQQDSFRLALEGNFEALGFLDIIDEYGVTKSANLASYYAGISYLHLGEYKSAIEYLKKFDARDELAAPVALGAIGDAFVELDDLEGGIKYYNKAIDESENSLTTPIYLKKAGITYEALNEYKHALELYETIEEKFPQSDEARDIQKYIAAVKAKL
jgi:tetratricopeptide (TPR) repeat protein